MLINKLILINTILMWETAFLHSLIVKLGTKLSRYKAKESYSRSKIQPANCKITRSSFKKTSFVFPSFRIH